MPRPSDYSVTFNPTGPKCTPDPLQVKASTTITWNMAGDFTFDGVKIGDTTYDTSNPGSADGQFRGLSIDARGKSMTITDTITDRTSHKYTLLFHADSDPDTQLQYDPGIENED